MQKYLSTVGSNDRQRTEAKSRGDGSFGVLCMSVLAFTSKNLGNSVSMNPDDLFGRKVCPGALLNPKEVLSNPLTDEEMAMRVLAKDLLSGRSDASWNSKCAFMFLTAGDLSFERVWEKFFEVMMNTQEFQTLFNSARVEACTNEDSNLEKLGLVAKNAVWEIHSQAVLTVLLEFVFNNLNLLIS